MRHRFTFSAKGKTCSTTQTSALLSGADLDKSLEHAAELMARGSKALKECNLVRLLDASPVP